MADADIIELLNGVDLSPRYRSTAADSVYLDEEGAPTDRFLEALKSQEESARSLRRSLDNADILPAQPVRRVYVDADNSSESDSDYSDYSQEDAMPWGAQSSRERGPAQGRRAAVKGTSDAKTTRKKLVRRKDEPVPSKMKRSSRVRRSSDDMILSGYTVGGDRSGRTTSTARRGRSSSASGVRGNGTRVGSPPRHRQSSADNIDLRYDNAASTQGAPSPNKDWSGDITSIREKMRTYRLRLAGQLQTIRSLEVKLGETELELRAKDTTLSETRLRLQALERREKNSFLRGVNSDEQEAALIPPATKERDAIRKLKTQIADLHEKVKEGNVKIRQGNERYKIAKTALDRCSAEVEAGKTSSAKLELALSDTQSALLKARREIKELASQVEAYKGQIQARQEAEEALQKDLLRAEGTLREIRSENDSSRSDLNRQAKEIGFLQESNRRMEVELRMLREKDAVHKLEKRALSKVISSSSGRGRPAENEDRVKYEYESEEEQEVKQRTENGVRSRSALGGMDTVLAWEKDYARRREQKLQRGESLSPPRPNRRGLGRDSSPGRPISGENPAPSVPPTRPKHALKMDDRSRYEMGSAPEEAGRFTADSLANAEQIRQKHDRLQQMYARVTKGKGTANVAVA